MGASQMKLFEHRASNGVVGPIMLEATDSITRTLGWMRVRSGSGYQRSGDVGGILMSHFNAPGGHERQSSVRGIDLDQCRCRAFGKNKKSRGRHVFRQSPPCFCHVGGLDNLSCLSLPRTLPPYEAAISYVSWIAPYKPGSWHTPKSLATVRAISRRGASGLLPNLSVERFCASPCRV